MKVSIFQKVKTSRAETHFDFFFNFCFYFRFYYSTGLYLLWLAACTIAAMCPLFRNMLACIFDNISYGKKPNGAAVHFVFYTAFSTLRSKYI